MARMRNQIARTTVVMSLLVPLTATICVASAPPAHAVGCWGDWCSGKDPQATGCAADAYTIAAANYNTASLQLRWSPTCKTNWARLVVYPMGWSVFNYGSLWAIQSTGYTQSTNTSMVSRNASAVTFWTPMIYSPRLCVKAVFYNQFKSYDSVQTRCL
jgi:hypothetical protein